VADQERELRLLDREEKYMLKLAIYTAFAIGGLVALVQPASAQCTDSRIVTGFQKTTGRTPNAAECTNLATAAKVCQDPWIAQAFYVLSVSSSPGLLLNGHSPMQYDSGRSGSTLGQCNYTNYGSWPDFATLISNVYRQQHPSVTPTTGLSVSLGLPGSMQNAQPIPVSWTYTGTPSTCGSGLALALYNIPGMAQYNWSHIASLTTARSATVQMPDWSRSLRPGQYPIQVALLDLCTGNRVSPAYNVTLNIPASSPGQTTPVALRMLSDGTLVDASGRTLPNTKGSYYLSFVNGQIVALGGGTYTAWVKGQNGDVAVLVKPGAPNGLLVDNHSTPYRIIAAGGGNFQLADVAGGAGNFQLANSYGVVNTNGANIILNSGGNIVAAGGLNIIAAGGGNFAAAPQQAFAQTIAKAVSNDGESIISLDGSLNMATLAKLVSTNR
jgi:hypothetical protein